MPVKSIDAGRCRATSFTAATDDDDDDDDDADDLFVIFVMSVCVSAELEWNP